MPLEINLPSPVPVKTVIETTEQKTNIAIREIHATPGEGMIVLVLEDNTRLRIEGADYAAIQNGFSAALASAFAPALAKHFGLV